ncbi:Putative defensin-like protein 157 [Linum perenne]
MAKISFLHIFTIALIFSGMVLIDQVDAEGKRCLETLYPSGCTLADCRQKCFDKHHDYIGGQCIANRAMTDYACTCVWTCDHI